LTSCKLDAGLFGLVLDVGVEGADLSTNLNVYLNTNCLMTSTI